VILNCTFLMLRSLRSLEFYYRLSYPSLLWCVWVLRCSKDLVSLLLRMLYYERRNLKLVSSCDLLRSDRINHLRNLTVPLINIFELVSDQCVVRLILVTQALNMIKYFFNFRDVLSYNPKLFFRITETLLLNIFNFIHRVFFLFSPLQFFVQEVKNHKVQTPHIISS